MPGARHYWELVVWKRGDQLRTEVFKLTSRPPFAKDLKARGQLDDAVNSVCRNIAEGFACDTHREFARFLTFSQRSLNEIRDAIRGAMLKEYINPDEHAAIEHLAIRLRPSLSRFMAYLRRTPDVKNGSDTTHRDCRSTRQPKPGTASRERSERLHRNRGVAENEGGEPRTRER
jgi:four helix bundle protein